MQRRVIRTALASMLAGSIVSCGGSEKESSAAARSQGVASETSGHSRAERDREATKQDDTLSDEASILEGGGSSSRGGSSSVGGSGTAQGSSPQRQQRRQRARQRLRAAIQAAKEAEGTEGPLCERAYRSMEAMTRQLVQQTKATQKQLEQRLPSKENFMAACDELPEEAQRCMLVSYTLQHRRECQRVKRDMDPALRRKVRRMMKGRSPAGGGSSAGAATGGAGVDAGVAGGSSVAPDAGGSAAPVATDAGTKTP